MAQRVNPRQTRGFAVNLGRLARTDRVGAAVRREMGSRLDLPMCPPETEETFWIKALHLGRRQLVEVCKGGLQHLGQGRERAMRASVARMLMVIRDEIERFIAAISALVAGNPDLAAARTGQPAALSPSVAKTGALLRNRSSLP